MPDVPHEPESVVKKKEDDDRDLEKNEGSASEKSYYYDDAHGYEDFDPDSDDEDSED